MAQKQIDPREMKRKKKPTNTFASAGLFDVKKDDGVTLELDSMRYVAQHGQGGDRRA